MNPYSQAPARSFWKPAVAERHMFDIADLWQPKFPITAQSRIVTFGSCFAQHIGAALRNNGFTWVSAENPPFGLSEARARAYSYGIFSARTGNIYTATMLAQWVDWALGIKPVPDEVWEQDGRFHDPFRPAVEPQGFASADEARESRLRAVAGFRDCITGSDVFVFTLGLTERWIHKSLGHEYALCPGTAAGVFDPDLHAFDNLQFVQVLNALAHAMERMRAANAALKFLLTVSPVPLTATRTERHVLLATMESKSVLRAVAGQLATNRPYVDYFPSYEIINSPAFKGVFFEPNQRSVNASGVAQVMRAFFSALAPASDERARPVGAPLADEIVCHEELLAAFAKP